MRARRGEYGPTWVTIGSRSSGGVFRFGNVTDAGQRHVERARNWCGRERENIDFGPQLLEMFFVGHSKPLFLVNNDQPQVLELHIRGKQPVSPDDDIDLAECETRDYFVLLARRAEP